MVDPRKLKEYITVKTSSPENEVAKVMRLYIEAYKEKYSLSKEQAKVVRNIMACRTVELGGHIEQCKECGAIAIAYNPCNDRHCTKCGKYKRALWVEKQKVLILPIPYFHVTFTTDHAINKLVPANRKLIYDLIFMAVNEALKKMGKKYLGGQMGYTMVLHSWGQLIQPHIHIHCVVTGGALSEDGKTWKTSKKTFLFPVEPLMLAYRDAFCKGLRKLHKAGKLKLVGKNEGLDVEGMIRKMESKMWEVDIRAFKEEENIYEYLSRYVHQVAISNYRIKEIGPEGVRFTYKDNKDKNKKGKVKEMVLSGVEFIRRFLWHVMPAGYHQKRYFGLHNGGVRKTKLARARELLGLSKQLPEVKELSLREWLIDLFGEENVDKCAYCGKQGTRELKATFEDLSWLCMVVMRLLGLLPGEKPIDVEGLGLA